MARATRLAALVLLIGLALSADIAGAQSSEYPPDTTGDDSPPDDAPPPSVGDGEFTPGGTEDIGISSDGIVAGRSYTGTLNSHPVTLPTTLATSNGSIVFNDVPIPTDFELGAKHSITVVDAETGEVVARSFFYVTEDGGVLAAAPSSRRSGGGLVRTESDTDVPVKIGGGWPGSRRSRRASTSASPRSTHSMLASTAARRSSKVSMVGRDKNASRMPRSSRTTSSSRSPGTAGGRAEPVSLGSSDPDLGDVVAERARHQHTHQRRQHGDGSAAGDDDHRVAAHTGDGRVPDVTPLDQRSSARHAATENAASSARS